MGEAAGLAALGFWLFVAAVVVAGIWYDAREQEAKQETLRRIVESGREIDADVLSKILGENAESTADRDLKVAAMIVLAAAPGLAILGWFLGQIDTDASYALYGVSVLVGLIGVGLFAAAKYVESRDSKFQ